MSYKFNKSENAETKSYSEFSCHYTIFNKFEEVPHIIAKKLVIKMMFFKRIYHK